MGALGEGVTGTGMVMVVIEVSGESKKEVDVEMVDMVLTTVEVSQDDVGDGVEGVEIRVRVVVDGAVSATTLIERVDMLVESAVTVFSIVAAGNVTSTVFAGCVFSTVTVESCVSVAGGKVCVCAGALIVSVKSIDCTTVVAAACCANEDEGAEPELPSTATTEYVAARLCTKTSLGWKGKE